MAKRFRVGVIGVGGIAQIAHLPILAAREDVTLVVCMAAHIESAQRAQAQYHFQYATDTMADFLRHDLDCAFVLSPKDAHPQQVKALLETSIPVFCEKPMGLTLGDSYDMANLAQARGVPLMIGFNRRFAPVYQQAKATYGDLRPHVIVAQKNRPASEYRATLENAIHMVDLMRFFAGECVSVQAKSQFTDPHYETLCTAQLEFDSGTVGMLVASRACGQWMETVEMHGHGKSVSVSAPDSLTVTDNVQSHTTTMTPLAMGWARVEDKLGFHAQDDHFFHCLETGDTPLTDGADAYKTHVLMHQILTSAGLPGLE